MSRCARQWPLALDDQQAGAQRHGNGFELDARQGDQDGQRVIGLEDVDRRLPIGGGMMKELAAQALGPFHRPAGIGPHQCFELACRHNRLRAGPAALPRQVG